MSNLILIQARNSEHFGEAVAFEHGLATFDKTSGQASVPLAIAANILAHPDFDFVSADDAEKTKAFVALAIPTSNGPLAPDELVRVICPELAASRVTAPDELVVAFTGEGVGVAGRSTALLLQSIVPSLLIEPIGAHDAAPVSSSPVVAPSFIPVAIEPDSPPRDETGTDETGTDETKPVSRSRRKAG